MDLCQQSDPLLFNMPSRSVTAFLSKWKHLLISWLQSLSTVTLEPKKIKVCYCFHFSPRQEWKRFLGSSNLKIRLRFLCLADMCLVCVSRTPPHPDRAVLWMSLWGQSPEGTRCPPLDHWGYVFIRFPSRRLIVLNSKARWMLKASLPRGTGFCLFMDFHTLA